MPTLSDTISALRRRVAEANAQMATPTLAIESPAITLILDALEEAQRKVAADALDSARWRWLKENNDGAYWRVEKWSQAICKWHQVGGRFDNFLNAAVDAVMNEDGRPLAADLPLDAALRECGEEQANGQGG